MTASYSARPPGDANIPDVTGNYEGSNTRFFLATLTVVTTWKARFFIWGQDGNHFWGLSEAINFDLFDVMDHAVQQPLDIHLGFSPQGKTVQTLLCTDIGKNRFGYGESLRVNLSSYLGVDLGGKKGKAMATFPR